MPLSRRDADRLVERASAETGLGDFGLGSWSEGLEVLLGAVEEEAQLNDVGQGVLEQAIVNALGARLRLVDWAIAHADTVRPVDLPRVIVGMPRAGTTLLSYLLDQDPSARSLMSWEVVDPVPPPEPDELRVGPRVERLRQSQAMLYLVNPGLKAIHHEDPAGPTECLGLLAQSFASFSWQWYGSMPSYSTWLLGLDASPAYEHHRLALQVLQSRAPGRWTLKSPQHALHLEALAGVYPDARIVILHRDPVAVAASFCSLGSSLTGVLSGADHRATIARVHVDELEAAFVRCRDFVAARPDAKVVELRYEDLVADPVTAAGGLYAAFGEELSRPAEEAMRAWLADNPQGKHGPHEYSLGAMRLSRGELEERFGWYRELHGLSTEDVPD